MSAVYDVEHAGKFFGGFIDRGVGLPAAFQEGAGQTHPPYPGTLGRLGRTLKGAAGSPILDAGQVLIASMRLTTGVGDADRGEQFGQGSARYSGAGETMGSAYPVADWQGSAAQAYATANRRQAGHAETLATLDRSVQTVIAREAYQVTHHRDKLDDQSNYLADLSYVTWSIALIPGVGKAMKTALELAAVNAALSICSFEIYQLAQESAQNADQLRPLAGEYSTCTGDAAAPDLDDPPAPLSSDGPPGQGLATAPQPGVPAPKSVPGLPPTQPGPSAVGPLAGIPLAQPTAEAAGTPTVRPAPMAPPTETASEMATVFGAVGTLIGSMFTPLAAVLAGAAGTAGQSMPADLTAAVDESEAPPIDEGSPESEFDNDRDPADAAADAGEDNGPALAGTVAESEAAQPYQSTDAHEQAPATAPPPVPPAPIRPPQ